MKVLVCGMCSIGIATSLVHDRSARLGTNEFVTSPRQKQQCLKTNKIQTSMFHVCQCVMFDSLHVQFCMHEIEKKFKFECHSCNRADKF